MTATFRSLFARSYMKAALVLAPMIFIGAECDPTGPANTPLAMDAMRADISGEGSFLCSSVTVKDNSTYWKVEARGGGVLADERVIELDIPKEATVPYTINVTNSNQAVIYYCVPLASNACKNFFASKAQGGSGSISITHIGDYLEGTFNGTVKVSNGTETRTISSGEFKADL